MFTKRSTDLENEIFFQGTPADEILLQRAESDRPNARSGRTQVPTGVAAEIERLMQRRIPSRRYLAAGALAALALTQPAVPRRPRQPGR